MGRPNRFQIMELYKDDILSELFSLEKKIFNNGDLQNIFFSNKSRWRLPNSTTYEEFLRFLIEQKKVLKKVTFGFPNRKISKYLFSDEEVNITEISLSLFPDSYLSHYSAVTYYDLTNEIIKSVYVNKEQAYKYGESSEKEIPQKNIDAAFSKPMRKTNNFVDYKGYRIYLINGRNTGNLGVIKDKGVYVTNLERTLIDITVRPEYCGGVREVLNVFERAKGEVSVNKINALLKKLNYAYPYHQSIGFYLEKAGYKENTLKLMESNPIKKDFYLTYNIPEKSYSKRWRLYYPRDL